MTIIYGTARTTSGQPVIGRHVTVTLNRGAFIGTVFLTVAGGTTTDRNGYWEVELLPNSSLTPVNTYYIVRQFGLKFYVEVPDSVTPIAASSLLLNAPGNPIPLSTYVNSIGGFTGALTAENLAGILAGAGEGAQNLITSIDGRTGVVTLNDRYASISHSHSGVYAPIVHTHDYSATSHNHDGTYVKTGEETVTSVKGLTGAVNLDGVYSGIGHTHASGVGTVTSVQGRDGAVTLDDMFADVGHLHTGVYSPTAHNHTGVYSPVAHLHDARYVQQGEEAVTSVNGQTGAVVVSGSGGAVDSVDGLTGTVDLSTSYSALAHNHSGVYSVVAHNHDSAYSALSHNHAGVYSVVAHNHDGVYLKPGDEAVDTVDGRTGAVTLSDLYSGVAHNHSGVYSVVAHNHDAAYSALAHTHTYPVTSVDGATGAVSLSSTYAAAAHNHTGVYSPVAHNHDAAYSAIGHNHSGVYSVVAHDHAGVYSPVAHNHDSAYSALTHNHDATYSAIAHNHTGVYSPVTHTHTEFTAGTWTNATMGSGVGGTLQYRSEPIYGLVRLKTTARIYASGAVAAGATLATLPVGARPAHECKFAIAQGAEPTQNLITVKIATTGVMTIVNLALSGTQASGLVIDFTFSTT